MAPPLRVRLDQAARDELDRRYQTTRDATTRTRYQMVLLRAEGHPVLEVAHITRRSPDTVRRVLKRYLTGGPDAVPHRPHLGQPPHYPPAWEAALVGVEAVIDKDLASQLLARQVGADLFVMATDVDGVYAGWGTSEQRRLERVTPNELRKLAFAAGSMAPKVEAAVRFVEGTGKQAAIGGLAEIEAIVDGNAGTRVVAS